MCGCSKNLDSHHLITKQWIKTSLDPDNGITLCRKCHHSEVNSASLSPWFLWEKLKENRPDQYHNMMKNRAFISPNKQEKIDYYQSLQSLIDIFESLRPSVFVRSKYFIFSKEEEKLIVKDYKNDLNTKLPDIAKKYKCSISCIYEVLRRNKISQNDIKKTYKLRQRIAQGKTVCKLDKLGNFIETYSSVSEAAEKNILASNAIYNCLIGISKSCGGFHWIYKEDYENGKFSIKVKRKTGPKIGSNPTSKKVDQYDLDGNFIKTWNSIREAKDATGASNISTACKLNKKDNCTKHKSEKFIWKYHAH
jgi:hypothetical protein